MAPFITTRVHTRHEYTNSALVADSGRRKLCNTCQLTRLGNKRKSNTLRQRRDETSGPVSDRARGRKRLRLSHFINGSVDGVKRGVPLQRVDQYRCAYSNEALIASQASGTLLFITPTATVTVAEWNATIHSPLKRKGSRNILFFSLNSKHMGTVSKSS